MSGNDQNRPLIEVKHLKEYFDINMGMFSRSMGVPVMGWSFLPAVAAVGMERIRPLVYSCLGS